MLEINPNNQSALEDRGIDARDFISFFVRRRADNVIIGDHLWSDVGGITAPVINPMTGTTEERSFDGGYGIVSIDNIPRVHNISIQTVSITMNHVSTKVNSLFREYDAKLARVEIFRGLYVLGTRQLAAPAFPRFVGYINDAPLTIPEENSEGTLKFICVSHTAELTRANYETRSHESQQVRAPGDDFYKDTSTIGDREFFWGKTSGKIPSAPKKGLQDILADITKSQ